MTDKEKKLKIIEQIKALPKLKTCSNVQEAIGWSDSNPETKPHFILRKDEGHVIIH